MKNYAGLDLLEIKFSNINAQKAEQVKAALIDVNKQYKNFDENCNYSDKVIKHIANYSKLNVDVARTNTQDLALIVRFLPDYCANTQPSRDLLLVSYLKRAFKDRSYMDMNMDDRTRLIRAHKAALDIERNWPASVRSLHAAVMEANLAVAHQLLDNIAAITNNISSRSGPQYVACLLSMQIINYMDIMVYVRDVIINGPSPSSSSEIMGLYEHVRRCLLSAVAQLISLPEATPQQCISDKFNGLYFACLPLTLSGNKNKIIAEKDLDKHFLNNRYRGL